MQAFHKATIVSNEEIGESVRYVRIKPSASLSYDAGQFFILRVRDQKGDLVERSYSAANFDESELIEFVIRIEPHGHMSSLIKSLGPETELDIKGPFGHFGHASLPDDFKRLVLIAGGVGISPIRAMIQQSFTQDDQHPLQLFYGFRTADDFLFQEELESFAETGRLQIITAVSEEDAQWNGNKGFISDHLEGSIFAPEEGTHCFICGPPPMVKATREKLFALGFPRGQVHVEAW